VTLTSKAVIFGRRVVIIAVSIDLACVYDGRGARNRIVTRERVIYYYFGIDYFFDLLRQRWIFKYGRWFVALYLSVRILYNRLKM
jgi:hypothetical protein